ncbi:MAG: carboxymuconolactone decarboxylase family protein [Phycisphaerales bacterium]|nr:MAG: carboxymuconolactone decarboxylase family protein [Phycisphaerales bacterium]
MSRLKTIDPKNAEGRAKELFDGPLKGKHLNIFKGMANSPAALDAYLALSGALAKGELSEKEREVVQLAVGQENGCEYCTAAHTMIGKNAGLSEQQTIGARRGKIDDDKKLDALTRFSKTLHEKKGNVAENDIKSFKDAGYTDGAIAEVVANYALATYTNYFNHLNQTPVDLPEAPSI